MPTFIKTGLWENSTTAQVPKGWLNLTKLIKDNSGGTSGNYIPLTGTEEGKSVTGDVEFKNPNSSTPFTKINHSEIFIYADNDIEAANFYISLNALGQAIFSKKGKNIRINYGLNDTENNGIISDFDFSEVEPENKLIYAQRQYVERPQTLINCLNNATPEQLSTIKSILGIV